MNGKIIIGGLIILGSVIFGATSFVESNVEYADLRTAMATQKKVQVKGEWVRDRETRFDAERSQFIFTMVDANGTEFLVRYEGARPNNFELADEIVVKGRYRDGYFEASQILTKCPSKYESVVDQSGSQ